MNQKAFLSQLTQEAKRQSQLGDQHLLPPSLSQLGNFFWLHSWQVIIIFSIIAATVYLALNGISP